MKNPLGGGNGMVPHYSGTTLDAQARYAAGTKSILENYLAGNPQEPQNIIVGKSEYSLVGGCLRRGQALIAVVCRGLRNQGVRPAAVSRLCGAATECWGHVSNNVGELRQCISTMYTITNKKCIDKCNERPRATSSR